MADLWAPTAPWKRETCRLVFNDHCRHWGMPDDEHALTHAQVRLITEVAAADQDAGLYREVTTGMIESRGSTSSVKDDARRLLQLLADEGGWRLTRG